MEILKVIIRGELPVNCSSCRWWEHGRHTDFEVMCGLLWRGVAESEFSSRPEWCPLVTQEQALRDCASPFAKWEE